MQGDGPAARNALGATSRRAPDLTGHGRTDE